MITLLNLRRQHEAIGADLEAAIVSVLNSSAFIRGPFVERFQDEFANYIGVDYCIGVNSGTDAIKIILEAAGIEGEVIVPVNTAYPTAEAVVQAGATPIFCDCGEDYTIDVEHAESLIGPRTEAIIPVHLYGHPCDMDALSDLCDKHGLFMLEDCAHAHGATYKGKKVGSFGHAAAFSFNAVKILSALGDAGGIVTNDYLLANNCKDLADHGRYTKYSYSKIGHNSRLDGIQAAVLSVKLRHLDEWIKARRETAVRYTASLLQDLETLPICDVKVALGAAWHQFVIRIPNRDEIRHKMRELGVETGIHYPYILSEQPTFLKSYVTKACKRAHQYSREILSLPINESITKDEVKTVCKILLQAIGETSKN